MSRCRVIDVLCACLSKWHTRTNACTHTWMKARTQAHTQEGTHICMKSRSHVCTYTRVHAQRHAHTHAHAHASARARTNGGTHVGTHTQTRMHAQMKARPAPCACNAFSAAPHKGCHNPRGESCDLLSFNPPCLVTPLCMHAVSAGLPVRAFCVCWPACVCVLCLLACLCLRAVSTGLPVRACCVCWPACACSQGEGFPASIRCVCVLCLLAYLCMCAG